MSQKIERDVTNNIRVALYWGGTQWAVAIIDLSEPSIRTDRFDDYGEAWVAFDQMIIYAEKLAMSQALGLNSERGLE